MTGRECYQFCDVEVNGERYCGQMCDRSGWHKSHVCSDHLKVPRREVPAGANRLRGQQDHDMNCDICQEPIRLTEARDGIEMHDGRYEFEYVHDDGPKIGGNPYCDITCVATPPGSTT